MNFDGSELAYEDGPHAALCILGPGRASVLRQFRVRGGGSRQAQADEWKQRARSEPEKPRTGQSGLRQVLKTGVTWRHFSSLPCLDGLRCMAVEPTADGGDR